MTTSFDTDPNTQAAQTVAAAWASSPLGQPDRESGYDFADVADDTVAAETIAEKRPSASKHTIVALALAGGIGAGTALGLMFVDFTPDQTVVVPASPEHAVGVTQINPPAAIDVAELPPTAVAPVPAHKPADVATPPASIVGGSPEVVDVPVSDPTTPPPPPAAEQPEAPKPDEPENPNPEPPGPENPAPNPWVPGDLDFTNPQPPNPPDPGPKFEPPIVLPSAQPDPPSMPDLDIKAGS